MKNKLLVLIAALALAVTAVGCGPKADKNDAETGSNKTAQTEQGETSDVSDNYAEGASNNVNMKKIDGEDLSAESSEGNDSATLEESAVSIEDAKRVEADGKNLIIISYKFTNKSDNAESFMSIMKSDAFQDGMSMSHALTATEIEGFEPNSTAERIEPGKTITVQEAYVLANETSPVEVIVQEFHSESGVSVTKTFNLQ